MSDYTPASARFELASGLADRFRFAIDGDGVAIDTFDGAGHKSGRRLRKDQVQDLLRWLAGHGHTLEPTRTGHGTAYVFGMVAHDIPQRRYRGFLLADGKFKFLDDQGWLRIATPDEYDAFEPEPKPE